MDRIIEKKKWTLKKILTIVFAAAFGFFIIYLLFFRDKQSKLYVNKEQLSVAEVNWTVSRSLSLLMAWHIPKPQFILMRCREVL